MTKVGNYPGIKKAMASIKFRAMGKVNPVNLNVRFFHNKIDYSAKSNIFIDLKNWSLKTGKVKQNAEENLKIEIESHINNLSELIIKQFRLDFPKGAEINQEWLIKLVDLYHNKPKVGVDPSIYFADFLANYIEQSKVRINPKNGSIISPRTIQNYNTTLKRIKEYEIHSNSRILIKDVNLKFHNAFVIFLTTVGKYSNTLIEKYISQIKGFVKEARILGCETSPEIDSRKFTFAREETLSTYLNLDEIDKIFKLDLSKTLQYLDTRDMLIFGVWTGLRVGDMERMENIDISENRIRILSTEKTQAPVEIPIHPQVKQILKRRNNILPQINSQDFNEQVKIICKIAEITQSTLGSIKDGANRKKKDFYPKYKLISSHTCRRSFVSNHYGKLDDKTIMAITTHKSYNQYMEYVKITLSEHASKVENLWQKEEELKNVEVEPI